MDILLSFIGVLVGALIAGLSSWLVARQQSDASERIVTAKVVQDRRLAMTERASEFLASTYQAFASLRDLAVAPLANKRQVDKSEVWPAVYPMTRALLAIRINDSPELANAADRFDEALKSLSKRAKEREFTHDGWSQVRDEALSGLSEQFQDVARRSIRGIQAADL